MTKKRQCLHSEVNKYGSVLGAKDDLEEGKEDELSFGMVIVNEKRSWIPLFLQNHSESEETEDHECSDSETTETSKVYTPPKRGTWERLTTSKGIRYSLAVLAVGIVIYLHKKAGVRR